MRAAGGRSNARPERAAEGSGGGPVRTGLLRAGCDWGGESETGWGIARLFRYPQVLDVVAPNDEFGQLPEAVAVTRGADHVAEADVHPVVAADKVAVVGLAILELDEHRVPLRRSQERERQHHSAARRSGPPTTAATSVRTSLRRRAAGGKTRTSDFLRSQRETVRVEHSPVAAVSLRRPAFTWLSCLSVNIVAPHAPCWLGAALALSQTDGAAFATIPATGAATGRLAGRTVRGCRGCGGLVLRLCTPGEVQHLQSVLLRSATRPYSRAHDRMHARLPLSPRDESGRRHAGRGRAPRQQAPARPGGRCRFETAPRPR